MNTTIIRITGVSDYPMNRSICGLYPLERLILVLYNSGFRTFHIDLSSIEETFFNLKIRKRVSLLDNIEIRINATVPGKEDVLDIPANLFFREKTIDTESKNFTRKKNVISPVLNNSQFLIKTPEDIEKAEKALQSWIIDNTQGWVAKKINKRISLPMSRVLSKTGIHPNFLTVLNLLFAVISTFLLLNNEYWSIAAGGLLLQFVSIFDGVDGEVAKFTFKSSTFGGWLDTMCDYSGTLMFLSACIYLYYRSFSGFLAWIFPIMFITGVVLFVVVIRMYLKRYTTTGSFYGYETVFLRSLPEKDRLVALILKLSLLAKRQFYVLLICIICLLNMVDFIIPVISIGLLAGTLMLMVINIRYMK